MNMKRFELTYFHGPYGRAATKEVYHDIALSGMTLCQIHDSVEKNKEILTWCAQEGLRANVVDGRLHSAIHAGDDASCEALVKAVCDDFLPYPALNGFDICDEPQEGDFEGIGRVMRALRRYAPKKERVVNLFPNYATPEQLGSVDYASHLAAFVEKASPDFLSYDHYHFVGRGQTATEFVPSGDRRADLIFQNAYSRHDGPKFFSNMEAVRDCARAHHIEAMSIVLLTEHGPYRNLTREELSWEAGMCLAHGFKRVSYFTYYQPAPRDADAWHWDNAMVDYEGNRMPHWYDVQALSAHIKAVGGYLFPLHCEKVVHCAETEEVAWGHLARASGNVVCGCFDNGAVLMVNKNHKHQTEVRLAGEGIQRFDDANGTFAPIDRTLLLAPGEFVLLL